MQTQTKINIALVVVILVLIAGLALALTQYGKFKGKAAQEKRQLQADLETQETINENLVRSQAHMISQGDLDRIIRERMGDIRNDLDEINAKVVSVSRATGRLESSVSKLGVSDSATVVEGVPELSKEITWMSKDGSQELPWAWAKVKPLGDSTTPVYGRLVGLVGPEKADRVMQTLVVYMSNPKNAQWRTGTHPVEFSVTAAVAETDDGLQTQYVQLWAKTPDSEELIPLAVIDADFQYVDPKAPEFRWWSPHIDAGVTGVVLPTKATGGGTIGFTIASYGVTASDNIWRFGRIAVGTDGEAAWIEVDPVGYNLGKPLPVVDDVWAYVGIVVSSDGYGGAVSITSTW
jgi:archaellum component FlaC